MKKTTLLLFALIAFSDLVISQTIGEESEIIDISIPHRDVKLFYGNANHSIDDIVVLSDYFVSYEAASTTLFLYDRKTKMELDKFNISQIDHIVLHRIHYNDKNNYTYYTQRTPFHGVFLNQADIQLHGNRIIIGVVRVKRDYKILSFQVIKDKLKLDLLAYDSEDIFKPQDSKEKKHIKLNKYDLAFGKFGFIDNQLKYILFQNSPYRYKKERRNGTTRFNEVIRADSIVGYNTLFYKPDTELFFRKFYSNSEQELISSGLKKSNYGGYFTMPRMVKSKDFLWLYESETDSLLVFDRKMICLSRSLLSEQIKFNLLDTARNTYLPFYTRLFVDEVTKQVYLTKANNKKVLLISELKYDATNHKISIVPLKSLRMGGKYPKINSIYQGEVFVKYTSDANQKNYIYSFDLYSTGAQDTSLIDVKFKQIKTLKSSKDYFLRGINLIKNPLPLKKEWRKKYFNGLKLDTVLYSQKTPQALIESIDTILNQNKFDYFFSYLMCYDINFRIDIEEDYKKKKFNYFDNLIYDVDSLRLIEIFSILKDVFPNAKKEITNNTLILKTDDGWVFTFVKFEQLWFLKSSIYQIEEQE